MSGRRSHRARHAALGVGLVAIVLIAVLATRSTPPGTAAASPLGGKAAPAFSGTDLLTGRRVGLATERGRFVLVNFFASWCTPCQNEAGALEQLEFADRRAHDFTVLGVVIKDTASDARAFLRRTGATWPAIADPSESIAVSYGVSDPPESFLVAPDGRVVGWLLGQVSASQVNDLMARAGRAT